MITTTRRTLITLVVLGLLLALLVPLATARPAKQAGPLPRVAISATGLTDTATGAKFTPRGSNYLRLADSDGTGPGDEWYLSHFEPGRYDPVAVRAFLDTAKARKDNTVRIFVDEGRPLDSTLGVLHGMGRGPTDEQPVDGPYMDNVADFVRAAIERGVYTIPVVYRLPMNCYYYKITGGDGTCSMTPRTLGVEGRNAYTLDTRYVAAKREYLKQFSTALLARIGTANATGVLAYEAENESYMQTDRGPWSLTSGTLTPSSGGTYDLAVPAQRQQAADASLVQYTLEAKAGLLAGDPDGKLTMGFYGHQIVGKTGPDGFAVHCGNGTPCDPNVDYRYPSRALIAALYGGLDLIDIHFYPRAAPYSVASDLASAEADQITTKPWFVGEMGAFRHVYGNSVTAAASGMRTARADACKVGKGAKGNLFWTYDTQDNADQRRLFTRADAAIDNAVSTIARPDMCVR
jgi:hypothetical protein